MFDVTKRILVVGDIMVDRYYDGQVDRISPEAPVPVLKVSKVFDRPGGAANVAINIAKLGIDVTLIGYVGKDAAAEDLKRIFQNSGVDFVPIESDHRPTILKARARANTQQMLRLDFEESFATEYHDRLIDEIANRMPTFDAVILSDYAKGTLTRAPSIIKTCRQNGKAVFVDPKGKDFSIYRGATLITPNTTEFVAVVGAVDSEQNFELRAESLRNELGLEHVLITRGENGMTLVSTDGQVYSVAAEALEVFDVTGAGDTVIATLAAAHVSGFTMRDAVRLSNIAAGIVVGRTGTSSVTAEEILSRPKAASEQQRICSIEAIRESSRAGELIVMTNGCFDILHAGHVALLEKAKALGDRLVVAVNSDESVRRLKGDGRPINSLGDRIKVLSSLRFVDWVIPFDGSIDDGGFEDTPLTLIRMIKPNILVKGADYTVDTVVGASDVLGWGGKVEIIDLVEGRSTTVIAARLGITSKEQGT